MNMFLEQIVLILLCSFSSVQLQDNIFSFSPNASVCIGETVTLTCYVYPPAGEDFSSLALLSFNGSAAPHSIAFINNPANGLTDLGYSATGDTSVIPVMGDSARIQLTIDSYQVSDSITLFGCHGVFDNNGSSVLIIQSYGHSIAAPPSPPTALSVSLTSLSPATCSGSVSVAWAPGASDRSIDMYFLFLNGDLLTPLSSSVNSHSYSINIATDTVYTYSVTANSCAGNSTPSNGVSISVESYSLVDSPPLYLTYYQLTSVLIVQWNLVPRNLPLLLAYSLQLNYSYSQYGTVYSYTLSSPFSLLSTGSIFPILITPHNFSTTDGVVTNITACISITSQCGMPFYGDVLCGDFNAVIDVLPTKSTITTLPTTTLAPPATDSATNPSSIIIAFVMTVILMSIIFFSIITLLVVVIVYLLRKNKQLQSLPKRTPHPYEYIDLNMVSPDTAAIPSVPKDSAYYTPMQSVGTQGNSNVVPPVYANLK